MGADARGTAVILASFFAALGQMGDARFRRVIGFGVLLALLLLVAVYALFLLMLSTLTPDSVDLPFVGPVDGLHTLLGWSSLFVMLALSVFLMVPAAAAFAGLFLEDVVAAVEARHYGWLPPARPQGLLAGLKDSVNLFGLIVLVNIGLLLALPFTAGFALPVWYLANGYLLGREYFSLVALRRMPPAAMRDMRRSHGLGIWAAGVLMALPLSIPLVNLAVPVLGAATFTHLFHRYAARQG